MPQFPEDATIAGLVEGLALYEEFKPQSGEDWLAVAERFIAAGETAGGASPLFAGLVLAVRRADCYREALQKVEAFALRESEDCDRESADGCPVCNETWRPLRKLASDALGLVSSSSASEEHS